MAEATEWYTIRKLWDTEARLHKVLLEKVNRDDDSSHRTWNLTVYQWFSRNVTICTDSQR